MDRKVQLSRGRCSFNVYIFFAKVRQCDPTRKTEEPKPTSFSERVLHHCASVGGYCEKRRRPHWRPHCPEIRCRSSHRSANIREPGLLRCDWFIDPRVLTLESNTGSLGDAVVEVSGLILTGWVSVNVPPNVSARTLLYFAYIEMRLLRPGIED